MATETGFIQFAEGSSPSTPASTKWRLYFKTDGAYVIDDAGTETGPLAEATVAGNSLSVTSIYRSTSQNVSGSGTLTSISFDTEVEDDDSCWAIGTPTQIVIPAGLDGRKAVLVGSIIWSTSDAGTYRGLYLKRNSGNIERSLIPDGAVTAIGLCQQVVSKPITLAENDTFELQMRADTTGIGTIGGQFCADLTMYTID